MNDNLLTVKEVATILKRSDRTIRIMCGDGRLPAVNLGSKGHGTRWLIVKDKFEAMIKGEWE